MFDGVHLGHQEVIRKTLAEASNRGAIPVVVTFDRHPSAVVAPDRVPALIYNLPKKLNVLEQLGVAATLLLDFTPEFSRLSGEDFIAWLIRGFGHVQSISVGNNFVFGHKRSGNIGLLSQLGNKLGFSVYGLEQLSLGGRVVSSTRIRELIATGELEDAARCLGRIYSLSGKVVRGDQLGHRLGFPTANLDLPGLVTPPNGVYAVRARLGARELPGVTNIGVRPTLNSGTAKRVETHLLDFEGELYDQNLDLVFVARLRDEQKFSSLDDLKVQIGADISRARELLR